MFQSGRFETGRIRGWIEWLVFMALLTIWAAGLTIGRELHGLIHAFLLAAVYLLIRKISSTRRLNRITPP